MSDIQPKIDPDKLFRRRDAADALTAAGYPVNTTTLATMASRGTGPKFKLFGRTPLYRGADLMEWAERRTSPFGRSVSECEAAREAAA